MYDELNKETWLLFAIRNYKNSSSVTYEEFEEDLNRFKYVKRLFRRYETTDELKIQLILNHMTMLYNMFGDAATPLLFYKIDPSQHPILKAFLYFIDELPTELNNNINKECLKLLIPLSK